VSNGRMINWKGFKRKRLWPNGGNIQEFPWTDFHLRYDTWCPHRESNQVHSERKPESLLLLANLLDTVLKILILGFAFSIQSGYVSVVVQLGSHLVLI
jgi:hypothetical protein